jgi:hypothetical protein
MYKYNCCGGVLWNYFLNSNKKRIWLP